MFPAIHKTVVEFCSTHTQEECARFVENLILKQMILVTGAIAVILLVLGIYYLTDNGKKNRKNHYRH
jgi:uncharacterized membrane protein